MEIRHLKNTKPRNVPIFRKLLVTFSCFALIPILLIGLISLFITNRILYQNLHTSVKGTLDQTTLVVDNMLEEISNISEYYSSNTELKRILRLPKTDESILALEDELSKMNRINTERGYFVTIFGVNGQIYLNWYSDGMIYRNSLAKRIKQTELYNKLQENKGLPTWIPYMDNIPGYDSSKKVITLARNIMNNTLEGPGVLGFAVISIALEKESQILSNSGNKNFVVDDQFRIIMSQETSHIGEFLKLENEVSEGFTEIKLNDTLYLGFIKQNKTDNIYTVSMTPADAVRSQTMTTALLVILITSLTVIIIFSVAYYLSKLLAKPILALETHMRTVQEDGLAFAQVSTEIQEIRSLTNNYNRMILSIQKLIAQRVQEEQRRKEIEIGKASAELQFLRAQINPHFLFNTLNSIKWLAVLNGDKSVEEMLTALGRLLECSMQKGNDFLPLREEIDNVKAYIRIQQMRYGDKLQVQYNLQESILDIPVPKLILQPVVENAILHGVDKNNIDGKIEICAFSQQGRIVVQITDNGPGISIQKLEALAAIGNEAVTDENAVQGATIVKDQLSGIGLVNVQKRLKLLYGADSGLRFNNREDDTGAVVTIILEVNSDVETIAGG